MIEVEAPDGTIVEFPDNTPRDVMAGAMRKRFGGPQAPAAPAAPPSGPDLDMMIRGQEPGGFPKTPDAPAPAPTPAPTGGVLDSVLGVAGQGVRGAVRGIAGLAGLPVDLATLFLNNDPDIQNIRRLVGGGDGPMITDPVLGSAFNKRAVDAVGDTGRMAANAVTGGDFPVKDLTPQGLPQRVAYRIGEEFGAAALPVGAALNTAARVGEQGAKQLPAIARMMVEPAAINPTKFVQKEALAAGAAGAGGAAGGEIARSSGYKENSGAFTAMDVGGALTGIGMAGVAGHFGPKIVDIFNAVRRDPKYVDQVSKDAAVDIIAEAYGLPSARLGATEPTNTQPIVDAIANGNRVDDVIPGYQESLADRTGNSGLAGLEYSRQAAGSPQFAERNRTNVRAVDDAIQANAPQGSPGAFRQELEVRRAGLLNEAATNATAAQSQFEDAAVRLQSAMNADARGAAIRAPLQDALEAARGVERNAWRGIDGELPAAPLAQRFARIQAGLTESEARTVGDLAAPIGTPTRLAPGNQVPDPMAALTGRTPPPVEDAAPLREITSLRSEFTTAQRQAATQGDPARARLIGQYIDAIDSHLDEHAPELADAINNARAVSFDLNQRFTRPQTAIGETLAVRQSMPRVPDSDVSRRFVQPDNGNVADFNALMREAGDDPGARAAVRDEILAQAQRARTPDQVDTFVREHSRVLDQFPGLRNEITETAGLQRAANDASARQTELRSSLGDESTGVQGTSSVGRYLRYGDAAHETALKGVINAQDPAKAADELLEFAGNRPEAVEGLKRSFWDVMEGRTRRKGETTATTDGVEPWMGAALRRFLNEPRTAAVAARLYRDNPEHLENVRKIAETLRGLDTRSRARAPNASGTAQGMSQVLSPETVTSRLYAYKRGQISGTFLITSMAAVAGRRSVAAAQKGAIGRLVDEALTNPEAAMLLLKENNPANRAIMARKAKGWIGNEAGKVVQALNEEDEDPTTRALQLRVKAQ